MKSRKMRKKGNKYKKAYDTHKSGSKIRGVEFLLTFEEWLKIWIDSGHLHERGHKVGQYCMARFGDKGPYAVGNVKIILHSDNIREGQVGRSPSEETREKISAFHKGKFVSEITRAKQSTAAKNKVFSEETRRKLAEAGRRKVHSPEAREKMAAANRGKQRTLGHKHSEKSKHKMSLARKEYWSNKNGYSGS